MSYKQIPITAKILKTTKGGVTQPILNMGADVTVSGLKMKAPSPSKQVGTVIYQGAKQAIKRSLPSVRKYAAEIVKKASKTKVPSVKKPIKTINVKANAPKSLPASKVKPKAKYTKGQKLAMAAMATAAVVNGGSSDKKVTPTPKPTEKGKSYDQAYKDRDKKVYGGMDKSSYIKEAKRQNAVHKKTGKWDAKSSYDKPKAKVANTTKAKGVVGKDVMISNIGREAGSTEALKSKPVEKKAPKLAARTAPVSAGAVRESNRKNASADRKESRAARVAQKAKEARASGDTNKADRLKRREARITKRANKKRGQAADAINPTK